MKDAKFGGSLGLFRRVSVKFGLGGMVSEEEKRDGRKRGNGQVDWFST